MVTPALPTLECHALGSPRGVKICSCHSNNWMGGGGGGGGGGRRPPVLETDFKFSKHWVKLTLKSSLKPDTQNRKPLEVD